MAPSSRHIHRKVSTTGVNPPLVCLLCGMKIPGAHYNGIANSDKNTLLKDSQWKDSWKPDPKHVMVPSHEVEEAYISNYPRLWSRLCRAIIKESNTKYRSTGINIMEQHAENPCYAPNDPQMAGIGGKKKARYDYRTFTRFYPASIRKQPSQYKGKPIGYIVHAHCWVLFGRVEGLELSKAKLAKLIQVCRKYWNNNSSWEIYDIELQSVDPCKDLLWPKYGYDIYQSPLVVPAVQEAIDSANIESLRGSSIECHRLPFHFKNLPLEVAILITEYICPVNYTVDDIKNTRNMLSVFQWELPDWFWRGRLTKQHLFMELDGLKEMSSPVGWQLALDLMSLVSDLVRFSASGLANRERVLGIMFGLEKTFLE